jgi:UDP-sulfoquinovose synthase
VDVADVVQRAGKEHGLEVVIDRIENPRFEAEDHYYNPRNQKLLDLGLEPSLLSDTLVESMFDRIAENRSRVLTDHILPRDRWRG